MTAVLVEAGPDAGAVWHFGEPHREQRALVAGTAWADLSHRGVIAVEGPDRLTWLHALTTQHLEQIQPGQWTSALILDAQGHIEHQFFLVDDGTTTTFHTEKERVSELVSYLEKMKFMLQVEVSDQSEQIAVLKVPGLTDDIGGPYAFINQDKLAETAETYNHDFTQVGMWALEAERIANGRARLLFETDFKSIPNELGFLHNAVHMNKGCYRGQETVAKVFNLGQPPRRLVRLHLDGSMVSLPGHGSKIGYEGKEVGYVGSSERHYELGPIALAVIKRSVPIDALLVVDGIAASQEALV